MFYSRSSVVCMYIYININMSWYQLYSGVSVNVCAGQVSPDVNLNSRFFFSTRPELLLAFSMNRIPAMTMGHNVLVWTTTPLRARSTSALMPMIAYLQALNWSMLWCTGIYTKEGAEHTIQFLYNNQYAFILWFSFNLYFFLLTI